MRIKLQTQKYHKPNYFSSETKIVFCFFGGGVYCFFCNPIAEKTDKKINSEIFIELQSESENHTMMRHEVVVKVFMWDTAKENRLGMPTSWIAFSSTTSTVQTLLS